MKERFPQTGTSAGRPCVARPRVDSGWVSVEAPDGAVHLVASLDTINATQAWSCDIPVTDNGA